MARRDPAGAAVAGDPGRNLGRLRGACRAPAAVGAGDVAALRIWGVGRPAATGADPPRPGLDLAAGRWTQDDFGPTVAVAAGWLAALSPYHLRYSQELRPYAYLLFFALLTLVLSERVLAKPSPLQVVSCGIAAAAGLYSHNLFILIVVPIVCATLALRRKGGPRWGELALGGSAALALLVYVPWLARAVEMAQRTNEPSAQTWWYGFFSRLWQFLTVAGREGEDLTWGGVLMLALVAVGLGVATRRWPDGGLAVVAGALVGTAGVETFFHLVIRRWSVAATTSWAGRSWWWPRRWGSTCSSAAVAGSSARPWRWCWGWRTSAACSSTRSGAASSGTGWPRWCAGTVSPASPS